MNRDPHVLPLYSGDAWRTLSALPQKFDIHGNDTNFRESWHAALGAARGGVFDLLQRTAVLILKPETILSRRSGRCIEYMNQNDFLPVHAEIVQLTPSITRDIWRHQLNIATLDRVHVSDIVNSQSESLMVFFADISSRLEMPASVRLGHLKGSANPAERGPGHLRDALNSPNRVLTMIHCPDEPSDIVRELGVFFDRHSLPAVYRKMTQAVAYPNSDAINECIEKLHARTPRVGLNVEDALERVVYKAAQKSTGTHHSTKMDEESPASILTSMLRAAQQGRKLTWSEWKESVEKVGISSAEWDSILIASEFIEHDTPDADLYMDGKAYTEWLIGEGAMVAK
ncbi:nucleoside-diphosphate kinase [Streptomyces sp. NBC_01643]|uniref:nucleoside-diphosphate kinase n=1 Tax=Streptomyces sp. NBC_01643 TaxID=2975906 RepID=UPI002F91742E|nr:hypothetical protein OHB03_48070 [Streptomyces sp. NBC_01643]